MFSFLNFLEKASMPTDDDTYIQVGAQQGVGGRGGRGHGAKPDRLTRMKLQF